MTSICIIILESSTIWHLSAQSAEVNFELWPRIGLPLALLRKYNKLFILSLLSGDFHLLLSNVATLNGRRVKRFGEGAISARHVGSRRDGHWVLGSNLQRGAGYRTTWRHWPIMLMACVLNHNYNQSSTTLHSRHTITDIEYLMNWYNN